MAIGRRDASKEYQFERQASGSLQVTTKIMTQLEYLPGTTTPYDGTPGIDPDLVPGWSSRSVATLKADEVEAIFGDLVDLSRIPAVEAR